jgi:hypothetical protein
MIIDSSLISMASSHSRVQEYQKTEEMTVTVSNGKPQGKEILPSDKILISDKALQHLERDLAMALKHLEKHMDKAGEHPEKGYRKAMKHLAKDLDKVMRHLEDHMEEAENREVEEPGGITFDTLESDRAGFLKNLIEVMTGRKIKLHDMDDSFKRHHKGHGDVDGHDDKHHVRGSGRRQQWAVSYALQESLHEKEQMTFNSSGIVRTADGREINFTLDLMMSRQYLEVNNINLEASGTGEADILVEFAGPASALTGVKFGFEIEPDDRDSLSYLAIGSGLLSLDLNKDGQIDSLNELLGTATGNGFDELAVYDMDNNGWIDKNDEVYNRLQILSQDAAGNNVLSGLKDSNIGAIYLNSLDTPFSLKNDQYMTLGQIVKSGIYLAEDGTAGQVKQLSMIV